MEDFANMVVVGDKNIPCLTFADPELTGRTIGKTFLSMVSSCPDKTLIRYKKYGSFRNISRFETYNSMKALQIVLKNLGIRKGDRVALLSENRQQLVTSILSITSCGIIAVPIHSELTCNQIQEILENSNPKCLIISDENQLDKLEKIEKQKNLPVITFDNLSTDYIYYKDIIRKYRNTESSYEVDLLGVNPDDTACILYNSDENGALAGTIISHRNIISSTEQFLKEADLNENDITLSYLPLTMSFGGIIELYSTVFSGGIYSIADNAKINVLIENFRDVGATVFYSVPRVLEKMYEKYAKKQNKEELFKISTGGTLKTIVCAEAHIDNHIADFYEKLGIKVYQFYGHTETSGAIAVKVRNNLDKHNIWKIFEDTSVKINSDGEILVSGENVSYGYYHNSHADNNFTHDGWFKTGDLGIVDGAGYLKLLNKKKDIITLSTGYKVSPQKIENIVNSEFIKQLVIIGEGKKFLSALIVPDFERLKGYTGKELKITNSSFDELVQNKWVRALYKLILEGINEKLPSFEAVRGYSLLTTPFTTDSMELTPSGKPIRNIIQIKRKQKIEEIYRIHDSKRFI